MKEEIYLGSDVEASGPVPGKYSMLSFGVSVVWDRSNCFYRELKPTSMNYVLEAMKVGCLGLECLDGLMGNPEYNPRSDLFKPELVLARLQEVGVDPAKAMADFVNWALTIADGRKPVLLFDTSGTDAMFIFYYIGNYYSVDKPLGHTGRDIASVYKGYKNDMYARLKQLKVRDDRIVKHCSRDDSKLIAKKAEVLFELMKRNKKSPA